MTLSDNDLEKAKAGDSAGTQRLFAAALPECARIAQSVCGSTAAAARVLKALVQRAPDQLLIARDAGEAGRWFARQTIMLSREQPQPSDLFLDTLLLGVGGPDVVQYQAMIGGLRKLPRQQQEAFILTHGENWNDRLASVAMDCSTQAVNTHLEGATRVLGALVGEHLPTLAKALGQVHRTQPIDLPQSPLRIANILQSRRRLKITLRALGWCAIVIFVVTVAVGLYFLLPRIKI